MKTISAVVLMSFAPAMLLAEVVLQESFAGAALPEGWKLVTPGTVHRVKASPGAGAFRMAGEGDPHAKGRLVRAIAGLQTGEWYRFEVSYSTSGVPTPNNAVIPLVQWASERRMRVLTPASSANGRTRASMLMKLPEEAGGTVNLHLFAGFIPKGSVSWHDVRVERLPGYTPATRNVRVAVIDSQPAKDGDSIANAKHYAAEIDKAASAGKLDIVVLPENFNRTKVTGKVPVSIESPYMKVLTDAVRRNRVYLTGSIQEERDGAVFNAAVLIDREGKVAGYYRKSHLTVGEMVFSDLSRGDEVKLFETDFGKVGVAVCFDFHFPEFARMLALRGAELLLVPMASDGRLLDDGGQRGAEHSGKAFVIENRIPVVFAATLGSTKQPSLIIDQHGKILARSTSERHIIDATLDLAADEIQWSGDAFRDVYKVGRRPEMYGELSYQSVER